MRALSVVIVVLGVIAGAFLIGRDFGTPSERASQPAAGDRGGGSAGVDVAALERLSRSVEALQAAVERLARRLDQRPERGDTRPGAAQDRIVVDLFEVEPVPGAKHAPGSTPASIHAAPDPERRKRLEDIRGMKFEDVNRQHWFWTFEDALNAYGPPDEIHPQEHGRLDFVYRTGDRAAHLQFYSGRLIVINWY